jgi:PBP1b-binding outer membrane lipoprotein LpoB
MLRIGTALLLSALLLGGCVKDQQAARTRNSGVDKEPEKHETPTPEKVPADDPPPSDPHSEELPPVEKPQ